jgi:FTR1 family protein
MHENARTLGGALPRRSSAGLAIAAVLGYLVYAGGNKLNLKTFFNITGILLVLFAAGLAGKAIPNSANSLNGNRECTTF